ncbi:MAG: hypothetical protein JSV17_12805 [Candidatus Aminicenantes bacterium]|nr:MAG: hypothetical protein JSV17_12805 [Candidatus Aminicenantes bacterium]
MRSNIKFAVFILVTMSLVLLTSCVKKKVDEPDPLGPAGFAISLKVSASPNVLFAGMTNREITSVTASLRRYDGTALAGRTVFFEVYDALTGMKTNVGYFDNMSSVMSAVTDGNGNVTVGYHGPLAANLLGNAKLYISAHIAWEGAEDIMEWTPIYVVGDPYSSNLMLNVLVDPNVLWCTNTRPISNITIFFTMEDGAPVTGRKIFFEILDGKGNFQDGKTKTFKTTNSSGMATINYIGPTSGEMSKPEEWVKIEVHAETWWAYTEIEPYDGDEERRHYLHTDFRIRLKKGN